MELRMNVNGVPYRALAHEGATLLDVLHDQLQITSPKRGCDFGECGNCNVLLDGRAVPACLVLADTVGDLEIQTVEALAEGEFLHPLQQAFLEHGAVQCGYCTPAMLLTAKALLDENPEPTELEIREHLAGVLCRCTGYKTIVQAIQSVARGQPDGSGPRISARRREWRRDAGFKQWDR